MAYPGYGAPPPGGYGGAPPPGGYGAAPPQGGPYGAPPQGGPYGAPPQGGYGAPAYGAPPAGGYGAPPQAGFGAPQQPGFGAPHPGGYPGQPQGGINPEIQQWFMSVDSDRSGRITANELQRALVNADWSQFNPETCRLMIGMFDKDCSGTIDIHEFQALWHYIKQWKSTFDSYDSNRSGNVEAVELQRAFQSMGYNLSPQFVQTVVVKFDHLGRRSLTFDSFIQASVMLKSLTDAFRQRDSTMSGSVRMSYEDFMSLAVAFKP